MPTTNANFKLYTSNCIIVQRIMSEHNVALLILSLEHTERNQIHIQYVWTYVVHSGSPPYTIHTVCISMSGLLHICMDVLCSTSLTTHIHINKYRTSHVVTALYPTYVLDVLTQVHQHLLTK